MITLQEFRAFTSTQMMALEAVVADVYTARCAPLNSFVLFDGGAHRGYHTLRMLALKGCKKVIAVEADPFMADVLLKTLEDAGDDILNRVELVESALQNNPRIYALTWKSSTSHMGRSSISGANAQQKTIWPTDAGIAYRPDLTVRATTIDKTLAGVLRPVPFIKLDLEGADLLALFGAERTLQSKRPLIAFENAIHAPKVHGFSLENVMSYLSALDYVPLDFLGEPLTRDTWFGFFEAWATPREQLAQTQALIKSAVAQQIKTPIPA